jgi:hypothetical protein
LAIDGKRMIIIMSFLNCIQEKKHGKAGRVGVGGKQWSQFLIGFETGQGLRLVKNSSNTFQLACRGRPYCALQQAKNKNIATAVALLAPPTPAYSLPCRAFFPDIIKETHDNGPPLTLYQKKRSHPPRIL